MRCCDRYCLLPPAPPPTDDELLEAYHAGSVHFWRSSDGRRRIAQQFETGHLRNTIAFIERRYFRMEDHWSDWFMESVDDVYPIMPSLKKQLRLRRRW